MGWSLFQRGDRLTGPLVLASGIAFGVLCSLIGRGFLRTAYSRWLSVVGAVLILAPIVLRPDVAGGHPLQLALWFAPPWGLAFLVWLAGAKAVRGA
jgi:hypothetical protein